MTLLAGAGDALTTAEAAFTLFYVAPVAIVAWFRGLRAATLIIGLCVAITVSVDVLVGPRPSSWRFLVWNAAMETALFFAFAYTVALLRGHVDGEGALRRAALGQLRHAERLNTVGKLASGVAHELGTPLSVIAGRADLILEDHMDLGDARKSARIIGAQTTRMETLIRNLLAFARRGGTETAPEDLRALCQETIDLLAPFAKQKNIDLVVRGEPAVAPVNRAEIQQVVTNLVANAVHASPDDATIEVTTEVTRATLSEHDERIERSYVVVRIRDEGRGITPSVLPFIFDPFFTTKEVGEGTGLGLSIVFGIVRDHGGAIRVETALGEGTTFLVYLPQ